MSTVSHSFTRGSYPEVYYCIFKSDGRKIPTADRRVEIGSDALETPKQMDIPSQQERRASERASSSMRPCTYELSKFLGGDTVELSEGDAFSINMSVGGMLLLLPQALGEKQVFQIQAPSVAKQEPTTKLVEACWTRPIPVDAHTSLHLVGVRFLFEPPSSVDSPAGH